MIASQLSLAKFAHSTFVSLGSYCLPGMTPSIQKWRQQHYYIQNVGQSGWLERRPNTKLLFVSLQLRRNCKVGNKTIVLPFIFGVIQSATKGIYICEPTKKDKL